MLIDFDRLRADKGRLISVLNAAGAKLRGKDCRCPFHDDRTASAGIYQGEDGGWRFKCNADSCGVGGDVVDIMAALDQVGRDVMIDKLRKDPSTPMMDGNTGQRAEKTKTPPKIYETMEQLTFIAESSDREAGGKVVQTYTYTNPETMKPDMIVFRLERNDPDPVTGKRSKTFRQARPEGNGFALKSPDGKWPLYNRIRIAKSEFVIVVEGEKAVHALADGSTVGTTSPGGAGKCAYADWSPLAGKIVYLWPDNDPPEGPFKKDGVTPNPNVGRRTGIEHMREVAEILEAMPEPPKRLYWINPDAIAGLPEKGDAFDYLEFQQTKDDKKAAIDMVLQWADPLGAVGKLRQRLADIISGKIYAIEWPWRALTATQALLPGTLTVFCGSPGASKSLMLLQAASFWYRNGVGVKILMLEDDKTYHLQRALSQLASASQITNLAWVKENPDIVEQRFAEQTDFLMGFEKCIEDTEKQTPTVSSVLLWIRQKCEAGARILIVDPYTIVDFGRDMVNEDKRFIREAKYIVEDYGASLILVLHPKDGSEMLTLGEITKDNMALTKSAPRFAQCCLWLHSHEYESDYCKTPMGTVNRTFNRTTKVLKARNSIPNKLIAMNFLTESLTVAEEGEITSAPQ